LAHGIHLSDSESERLSRAGAALVHCPTAICSWAAAYSTLKKAKAREYPLKVAIATDVGAGTSLSLLANPDEAYKVAAFNDHKLSPFQAFYLATLGGAKSLSLDDKIGNFMPGKEADFVVLDFSATPLLEYRNRSTSWRG